MTSPFDRVAAIAGWLAAAGIDELDLTGPDGRLRLRRAGASAAPATGTEVAGRPVTAAAAAPPDEIVASPGVGLFLHAHPLREEPFAEPDEFVSEGQTIGLLQVGTLLLPVQAPRDGVVAAVLAPAGALVGYGDPLVALTPTA